MKDNVYRTNPSTREEQLPCLSMSSDHLEHLKFIHKTIDNIFERIAMPASTCNIARKRTLLFLSEEIAQYEEALRQAMEPPNGKS